MPVDVTTQARFRSTIFMTRYFPDFDSFQRLAADSDLIPVYRQLTSDTLTPVTAYCRIQHGTSAFLFDATGSKGATTLAFWSYNGLDPNEKAGNVVDQRWIEASADGFATVPVAVQLDTKDGLGAWTLTTVDLTPLAGTKFQLRFRLNTVDGAFNNGAGWFIDDVNVYGAGIWAPTVQAPVLATIDAATAGSIINPTDISVPSATKPATTHNTTNPMNTICHGPPRPPDAAKNPGSRLSRISGRQIAASTGRQIVAAPAIANSA